MSKFDDIREGIKRLYEENIRLNDWISTQEQSSDSQVGEICKNFLQVLESYGVRKIEFPNGEFDAAKGKIVGTVTDNEKPEGSVASIKRDGFYRKEKLLRPAEVLVVKN